MASRLIGGDKFRRALRRLPEDARTEVAGALDVSIRRVQATAVALVPVHTGNLKRLLLSDRAIGRREKGLRVEFGFRTKALARKAWYAHFVEYGTKGYAAGGRRFAGQSGTGLGRYRKVSRNTPARPARPFMRPALDLNIPVHRRTVNAALKRAVARASRG